MRFSPSSPGSNLGAPDFLTMEISSAALRKMLLRKVDGSRTPKNNYVIIEKYPFGLKLSTGLMIYLTYITRAGLVLCRPAAIFLKGLAFKRYIEVICIVSL